MACAVQILSEIVSTGYLCNMILIEIASTSGLAIQVLREIVKYERPVQYKFWYGWPCNR